MVANFVVPLVAAGFLWWFNRNASTSSAPPSSPSSSPSSSDSLGSCSSCYDDPLTASFSSPLARSPF